MKRLLPLVLLLAATFPISSQEIFSKYVPIQSFSGLPMIQLSKIDDLVDLARQSKGASAFISWQNGNASSTLLVKADPVYYSFDLKGFGSVGDFQKGQKGGFPNGPIFYEADLKGISQYDFYTFFKRNSFASMEDCKNAYASGFIANDKVKFYTVLPLELSAEKTAVLSDQIPFIGIISQRTDAYSNDGKTYKLKDPKKRRADSFGVQSGSMKEYQVYYLALADGKKTYKEYSDLSDAVYSGFFEVKDFTDAKAAGFASGDQYYEATQKGFASADDFAQAQQLRIQTYAEYKPIKDIRGQLEAIMKKDASTFNDAAMVYVLTLLPRGKPYSVPAIADFIEKSVATTPAIRGFLDRQGFSNFEAVIKDYFRRNTVSGLGKYDIAAGAFTRN